MSAWNVKKPAPAVPFAHLMQQELSEKMYKEQEIKDFQLAQSMQEELGYPEEFIPVEQPSSSSSSHNSSIDPDLLLAMKLQAELNGGPLPQTVQTATPTPYDDDHLLALQMQAEFDHDFNRYLNAKEKITNANSNVKVSLDKYRLADFPDHPQESTYFDDDEDDFGNKLEEGNKPLNSRSGGLRKPGKKAPAAAAKKEFITKHDIDANSLKNARRMDKLPAIEIGNTSKVKDLRLPYKVYNSLRNHAVKVASRQEKRGKTKLFDKDDTSTQDSVLDKRTRLILLQMINKEILEEVDGILSTGKEANVYYGLAFDNWEDEEAQQPTKKISRRRKNRFFQDEEEEEEEDDDEQAEEEEEELNLVECAIKIFKTSLQEFRNREEYIRDDARYASRLTRHNSRKLIKLWAEKEMLNLNRLQKVGIPCPEVLHYDQHVLVLSFIGKDRKAAPKLKEVGKLLTPHKREELYEQCIQGMRKMYQEARLVHADLSEYNLLYFNHQLIFIDVSQSVETIHPNSNFFLLRDCFNITRFFRSIGVEKVLSELELFSYVTKEVLSSQGEEELTNEIQAFVKERLGENVQVSLRDADILEVLDRLFPSFVAAENLEELEKKEGSNGSISTEEDDAVEEN